MFEKPILNLVKFDIKDICTASNGEDVPPCDTETPIIPIG